MDHGRGLHQLHIAVIKQEIDQLEVLIRSNDDINSVDSLGNGPLHYCSDLEIAQILLHNGADFHLK